MYEIRDLKFLETSSGKIPFDEWYDALRDKQTKRIIAGKLRQPLKDFKDSRVAADLQDPEFAAGYLEDALDEDVQDFIIALRNVADANGGLGKLSQVTDLGRESLYKTLSENGDSRPFFATICQILNALGMKLSIHPIL